MTKFSFRKDLSQPCLDCNYVGYHGTSQGWTQMFLAKGQRNFGPLQKRWFIFLLL